MTGPPTLDGRDEDALRSALEARAAAYVPEWDPENPDGATALLGIGAEFGAALVDRVDRLPAAQRRAFADIVGTDRRRPTAARLPLSFTLDTDAERNVPIPAGTRTETADGERFETDEAVEATPASLVAAYAVDPDGARVRDHTETLTGDGRTKLFSGEGCLRRRLYVGDDGLDAAAGTVVTVTVETDRPLDGDLVWEYHGEPPDGAVGWHPLPTAERPSPSGIDGLRDRQTAPETGPGVVRERFVLPGETVPVSVDGVESHWLRCRAPDADPESVVEDLTITAGRSATPPDAAIANDVPLSPSDSLCPFGRTPQPPSTLYLRSAAFATPEASVDLTFEPTEDSESGLDLDTGTVPVATGPPTLSWEYHDGDGWTPLPVETDGTDALRTPGTVTVSVPADAAATTVSGHRGPWIRVRLVAGAYRDQVPTFGGLSVAFDGPERTPRLAAAANGTTATVDSLPTRPFRWRADTDRALYLGFDAPLRDGPLSLLWSLADAGDGTALVWERRRASDGEWVAVEVDDRTGGLSASGVVRLYVDGETTATTEFGEARHWLRVRAPDGWDETPTVAAVDPNAVRASNTRSVAVEPLGSSDGSPNQRFDCPDGTVIDPDLWVEESARLADGDRAALQAERPDAVEVGSAAVWVRWDERSDFLGAGPDDRVYTVDPSGAVRFGDGDNGAIPPSGTDNVRIEYRAGGGSTGNVPAGAVDTLASSIPSVADVTNPDPGSGGADAETGEAAVERAGTALRARGRVVTADDVVDTVLAADRGVARAHCRGHGDGIDVTVLPDDEEERPDPSRAARSRLRSSIAEATPATLSTVTVSGPTYAPVDVTATVAPADGAERGRAAVESALATFLHPVGGGVDGDGWPFGECPSVEGIRDIVAAADGVGRIISLSATVDGTPCQDVALTAAGMVCDGTHTVRIDREGVGRAD